MWGEYFYDTSNVAKLNERERRGMIIKTSQIEDELINSSSKEQIREILKSLDARVVYDDLP